MTSQDDRCQICQRSTVVELICTMVFQVWGSSSKELACWHVCADCFPHFEETVLSFYRHA
ncbi:hypothetical protein GTO89_14350 [Heliobacterium gestii]|uniref:Uncharacterized protein n=1 Tax=Heliomicrobium gestii TaxID=2699 RepID=A0A845LFN0_HELGE|nr:hypothetical protein [Heliomicrobium gestii]MBM7867822.1 hypothetical protein [Heliomicrobium gestii]MZP44214.1 hypothetical protein [Heliomicrobium gestii]